MKITPEIEKAAKELDRELFCVSFSDDVEVIAQFLAELIAEERAKSVPDVVIRALTLMSEERMAVGHYETEVRKCCESELDSGHESDCLVIHALDAIGAQGGRR